MRILISDYKDELKRDLEYEKDLIVSKLRENNIYDAEIEIYPYENKEKFIEHIKNTDVLLTAFLPIDKEVLDNAHKLKFISINATGYGNIDIEEASKRNIYVSNIKEYCTSEVAEHTMALMLSMVRCLKQYNKDVENNIWDYKRVDKIERLAGKTLAIFGLGRIGQAVAKRAKSFDLRVIAVDPYLPNEIADKLDIKIVSKEEALKNADIISNHMNASNNNKNYFSFKEFESMEKTPYFLNVGRGECVDEDALIYALSKNLIKGAGLDVLKDENPHLEDNILLTFDNVYITPHSAFYSETSMKELQRISCENIVYFLTKEYEKIFSLVNKDKLSEERVRV